MSKYDEILEDILHNENMTQEDWQLQKARLDAITQIFEDYISNPCAGTQWAHDLGLAMEEKNFLGNISEEENEYWEELLNTSESCAGCGWDYNSGDLDKDGYCEDCANYEEEQEYEECNICGAEYLADELENGICDDCRED